MSRTTLNFCLDTILLLLFLTLLWCSVVVQFVFPPGPNAAGWMLWGATYDQWCSFQFGVVAAMALAVLLHVMLHWTWVCGVVAGYAGRAKKTKKARLDEGTRTLYGVATLIVLLHAVGLAVAAAWLMIQSPSTL